MAWGSFPTRSATHADCALRLIRPGCAVPVTASERHADALRCEAHLLVGADSQFRRRVESRALATAAAGFLDDDEREVFLGIGSILWDTLPPSTPKVVFGTGYGGYTSAPTVDASWKIYCLRGRDTARHIGADPELGIGDPATLVPKLYEDVEAPAPSGRIAFMPHWESVADGRWQEVARRADVDFIDPRWDVDRVVAAIRACSTLVTEAMHGAIVADAFRTPWIPFEPLAVHHMKWHDWAETLDLTIEFAPSEPSTWVEAAAKACGRDVVLRRRIRRVGRPFKSLGAALYRERAVAALCEATKHEPHLSSEASFRRVTRALEERLNALQRDYPRRTVAVQDEPLAGGESTYDQRTSNWALRSR